MGKFAPSQEHGLCPPLGFQPPFLLNIAGRRPAMFRERPAEGPKVGFYEFRVFWGVWGV